MGSELSEDDDPDAFEVESEYSECGEIFEVDLEALSHQADHLRVFNAESLSSFDCQDVNDGLQFHQILCAASIALYEDPSLSRNQMMSELQWLLVNFFRESDVAFLYIDRVNEISLAYKDLYGKRSLLL